jgi:Ran GTPase-activating protein (RanGAP) involved in mRNA processing and transport
LSKGVKIDLSDNDLSNASVDVIASFLQNNACVKEIRLGGNYLDDKGIEKLMDSAGPRRQGHDVSICSSLY